ncbi:MAG: DUF115 domain-containing protein [Anaerolineales bacterium]|nr:DUF115 domain-containing protein [Anaerolineales bacterium]
MARLKPSLKRITPDPVWRPISNTYWWWRNRGQHQLAGLFSSRLRESREKIHQYKDRYKGQRCFIIGNGPSLRKTDLSLLRDEITFGLNRIYIIFPELNFQTTFLLSVNDLVIQQCAEDFKNLELPKFFTWRSRKHMRNDPRVLFMDTDYTQPETFTSDMTGRIYEGCTVTYVALQMAFYMGFESAILIGVDHSFKTKGPPNVPVISEGDDPNHFHPEYFGKGFVWQLPDYECSERAYQMARNAYEADGRQVLDATIDGKLTIFPKVNYASLF